MEFLPLVTIPVTYLFIALIKPYLRKKLPFNVCAICIAVSLTWLLLLTLWLLGEGVSEILIATLMGMSLTGLMYKLEKVFEKLTIRNFWFVRLVIIVGGFYLVYAILSKDPSRSLLLAIAIVISVIIPTFFFQGSEGKPAEKSGLYKKLDDCC